MTRHARVAPTLTAFLMTLMVMALLAAAGLPAVPASAAPAGGCVAAGHSGPADLWPQRLLAADRAWPFSRAAGQRIAVIDSGVDAAQPLLRGHVVHGFNAVTGHGPADTDCAGTGTQVAGTIVAGPSSSSGIEGVAPGATIVPIRVTGQPGSSTNGVPPAVLARALAWATGHHIDVIDVSVAIVEDDPRVREAVAGAIAAGITVVAAAGDAGASGDNPVPYPAAYPGVIGVAAIGANGARAPSSGHGPFVDLVAPGAGVDAIQRGHGWVPVSGNSAIAAGYASGVAALVRGRWPTLSPGRIAGRLLATAAPSGDSGSGWGLVNAYAAVTDGMVYTPPTALPSFHPARPSQTELDALAARDRSRRLAVDLTLIGLGVLVIVVLAAIGIPRARRRGWRPAYAAALPDRIEPDEPQPPTLLFEDSVSGR